MYHSSQQPKSEEKRTNLHPVIMRNISHLVEILVKDIERSTEKKIMRNENIE